MLIAIKPADVMLVKVATGQTAQLVRTEPGLGFEPERVERAVVADEQGGLVKVSHG